MATPNIVPKADQEGGLGTAAKSWGKLFINQAASQSTPAFTLENSTVDQIAFQIDAENTTAAVIGIDATQLTTGHAITIGATQSAFTGDMLHTQYIDGNTGSNTNTGLIHIDYDKSGVVGVGATRSTTGLHVDMVDAATNNASGTVTMIGAQVDIDSANAQGTINQKGLVLNVAADGVGDASLTRGIVSTIIDGGKDLVCRSHADTGDHFSLATTTHGATTLTTVDDDAAAAHLSFDVDGDINFYKTSNTDDYLNLRIGANGDATFTTLDAAAHAADMKFVVDGDFLVDNDGLGLTKITSDGVEIENAASSGASALLIDNDDVDAIALDIDAANTTADVVDITSSSLTTGNAIKITATNSNFRAAGLKIDQDHDSQAAFNGANGMIHLDYDKAAATGDGNTHLRTGSYINMTDAAANHANSTVTFIGSDAILDAANTAGTSSGIAYQANVQDFKTNIGYKSTTEDVDVIGGINADFIAYSSQDSADYFKIKTTTSGATSLQTVDGGAAAADLTFAPDGIIKHVGTSGESRFYNTLLNVGDYMSLVIGANGDAKFTTVDAATAAAHFEIEADGSITLDAVGTIELEGTTNVTGDLGVSAEATVASLICTAAASFGGGYGSTGTTISTAGVGQFNGALTTDAALTADNIVCTNAATFGGGTGSTGVTISTAGVVTADGLISSTASGVTGVNYRTIWIDAGSMVPQVTNGAAAGTSESADAYDVMNDYFAFDASTIEFTQYKLAMPLQWNGGTIKAKFYWKPASSTTTSHSVMWAIDGQAHADGGELGAWGTTVNVAIDDVIATDSPKKVHVSAASGAVTIAGSPAAGASELVYLRFQRVANHATDDLNEDAHLLGVAIQYQETAALQAAW